MSTTKKGNPLLSVRIPSDLNELLEARMQETGGSRSDVAIEALECFLRPASLEEELPHLKHRLQQVETALNQLLTFRPPISATGHEVSTPGHASTQVENA